MRNLSELAERVPDLVCCRGEREPERREACARWAVSSTPPVVGTHCSYSAPASARPSVNETMACVLETDHEQIGTALLVVDAVAPAGRRALAPSIVGAGETQTRSPVEIDRACVGEEAPAVE